MTIDPDLVARTVSRDQRFAVLQEAIAVEADMRDNATIKALIRYVEANAELAMVELTEISPLDTTRVAAHMVRVRTHTSLRRMLKTIQMRGALAEQEIRQADERHGFDEEQE